MTFDYASFFTSKVYKDIYAEKESTIFSVLLRNFLTDNYVDPETTIYDFLEIVYSILKEENNRKEYLYKNALVEKLLLGKHSFNTATIINELRAGKSKIDLALVNETLTAFEIKSENDTLSRINNQIKNYQNIFSKINIIAGEKHIDKLIKITPKEIGILKLSKRYQISTIREAIENTEYLSSLSILESCRTHEAIKILSNLDIKFENYPNTLIRSKLINIFKELDPLITNRQASKVLKETRSLIYAEEILRFLPKSLYALSIQQKITKKQMSRVNQILCTKISSAIDWGK